MGDAREGGARRLGRAAQSDKPVTPGWIIPDTGQWQPGAEDEWPTNPAHRERHYRHRDWHRGERIEVVYLEPRYYVDDYEYYHLRQPPRGHRWVRDEDGRFILVAVATGIIADILLHH
jgi:Ni/Co efflux regulator RcnB